MTIYITEPRTIWCRLMWGGDLFSISPVPPLLGRFLIHFNGDRIIRVMHEPRDPRPIEPGAILYFTYEVSWWIVAWETAFCLALACLGLAVFRGGRTRLEHVESFTTMSMLHHLEHVLLWGTIGAPLKYARANNSRSSPPRKKRIQVWETLSSLFRDL